MGSGYLQEFSELDKRADALHFQQMKSKEETVATLVAEGASPAMAQISVESAYDLRHLKALSGELEWDAWIAAIARDPAACGTAIRIVTLATVPVTYFALKWGFGLFSPGVYPWIVLSLPGLVLGVLFFLAASYPIYLWQRDQPPTVSDQDEPDRP